MPKTLACDLRVEFVPLPKGQEAAWMYAMGIISEILHKAKEQANAEALEQKTSTESKSNDISAFGNAR